MAIPVTIFNANNLPINLIVNNGTSMIQIAAAAGPNWTPQVSATNPTFNPGPPDQGNLGTGPNSIQITPEGSPFPFVATINLPSTLNWSSVQIYIFLERYVSCSWIVLNAGQQVVQGTVTSQQALNET